MKTKSLNRREFLAMLPAAGVPFIGWPGQVSSQEQGVDRFFLDNMERHHIPGLAVAVIKGGELIWSRGYGWANLDLRIPMTPDTLQNIGSISKTFTATAVMQLWEQGKFQLDDDVNQHLPFVVAHPAYPGAKITFRSLLTHSSSMDDGPAYPRAYACGDPSMSLKDWLQAYLTPDGSFYDAERNFHEWPPGERFAYCNVGYGLLAYLVETISGLPFSDYCRKHIFDRIGMEDTSWYLKDIDTSKHAVPYSWISDGEIRGPSWGGISPGVIGRPDAATQIPDGYAANCLYNHPNFPDGFLRTSVHQLCSYATTYLNEGRYDDYRLLQAATIKRMFRIETQDDRRVMGLTWNAQHSPDGDLLWGHGGSDPGINANLRLRFSDRVAAIVLMNTNFGRPTGAGTPKPLELAEYLIDRSADM